MSRRTFLLASCLLAALTSHATEAFLPAHLRHHHPGATFFLRSESKLASVATDLIDTSLVDTGRHEEEPQMNPDRAFESTQSFRMDLPEFSVSHGWATFSLALATFHWRTGMDTVWQKRSLASVPRPISDDL